jgi:cell division protein FtsB
LEAQTARNEALKERNSRVSAEVNDLREGLEMVEEKARSELGMLRPDEVLVQMTKRR